MLAVTFSPRSRATSAADVGLMRPDRVAEGAASGRPIAAISVLATGWDGTLSAMLSKPARARSETPESGRKGTMSVMGPGQNASASRRASALNKPYL
jgi:hypothetical protein